MAELLRLVDLVVGFVGAMQPPVLRGVNLAIDEGEAVALVGSSGCGKTLLARAALGLLPPQAQGQGRVLWRGVEPDLQPGGWQGLRGGGLTLIPQEPLGSLNPVLTIGEQVAEAVRLHQRVDRATAWRRAGELLLEVQLPDPRRQLDRWPHQLSGGMRQRVLLAAALACGPRLLIADEPTSALDVTVQRDILALIDRVRRARGMALMFITHDRTLVPLLTDRCLEMRQGLVVEVSVPTVPVPVPRVRSTDSIHASTPVLRALGVVVRYPRERGNAAVAGVDIDLHGGRCVGLVGESGAGKSSLARALAGHVKLAAGSVIVDGRSLAPGSGAHARQGRRRVQILFQDPGSSLNPQQRVKDALQEAAGGRDRSVVAGLMAEVGLDPDLADRYPHALSGGQRQRVALARCLAARPAVLIADEPTSALDADNRTRILELLAGVMAERRLALLVVSHDLDVLIGYCDSIVVMRCGHVVEIIDGDVAACARHPYTQRLLECRPSVLAGTAAWGAPAPSAAGAATDAVTAERGCPYAGPCAIQNASCFKELPPLVPLGRGHWLRCPVAQIQRPSQFIDT